LLVLTQYERVTDRQTDKPPIVKPRCNITERDNKEGDLKKQCSY